MADVAITVASELPSDMLTSLVADSEQDGFRIVRRLIDEWETGIHRFDRSGEKLFVARMDEKVIGVCGLNADTYLTNDAIGRVRRLYVLRACRGRGIGKSLVRAVINAARQRFRILRLRTDNPDAARFYERLGFQAVHGVADCTHTIEFSRT